MSHLFNSAAHDLYIVGSSLNGLGSNSSDVDMCIVLPDQNEQIDQYIYAIPVLKYVKDQLVLHSMFT